MNDFAEYLAFVRQKLNAVAPVTAEKDIAYGHQFTVQQDDKKTTLTVYNGKKGRRLVWGGAGGALTEALQAAIDGRPAAAAVENEFSGIWAGSDESGKGDFFGPLVVAAVVVDDKSAAALQRRFCSWRWTAACWNLSRPYIIFVIVRLSKAAVI